ncbi:MAG: hypothetical protein KDJ88_10825 [Bauldia sp.]|nr:hypothetical protein [Bauldia sp.]
MWQRDSVDRSKRLRSSAPKNKTAGQEPGRASRNCLLNCQAGGTLHPHLSDDSETMPDQRHAVKEFIPVQVT